ncbi:unnamed protein product [Didymodactylos carnosus]|uniref:Uncharacterized protein n=1 Tax=Didymodactylos carnosus TaxID=1234261 RepID=A0A815JMT3_9BILA|nr:unnamed protein product [Didymodactylos carnosus]CAF4276756.1 unnamed protein product [Didymodactylos carnosus]
MGLRADVLYDCGSTPSCAQRANGVGWYFSTSYCWGFANGTDTVNRNTCDVSATNTNLRMCWHTQSQTGWSCGSTQGLFGSTSWQRVIWHAD